MFRMPWRRETSDGVRPDSRSLDYRASADDQRAAAEPEDLPDPRLKLKAVLLFAALGLLFVAAWLSPTVRGWLAIFGH